MTTDIAHHGAKAHSAMMDLQATTPSLLTPSSESAFNPFFTSLHDDEDSFPFNFDYPGTASRVSERRTPSLVLDDDEDNSLTPDDPFGNNLLSRPRLASSSSIGSVVSSATPSEADIDEFFVGDREIVTVDNIFFENSDFGMGKGFHLTETDIHPDSLYQVKSNSTLNVDYLSQEPANMMQHHSAHAHNFGTMAHTTAAMNNFNLSDFLSDHDQEHQQQQQAATANSNEHGLEVPPGNSTFIVRDQGSRSAETSPSMSSAELATIHGRLTTAPQRSLSFHSGQQSLESHSTDVERLHQYGTVGSQAQRPSDILLRSNSEASLALCNPPQVPSAQQQQAHTSPYNHMAPPPYFEDSVFTSPPTAGTSETMPPPPIFVDNDAMQSPYYTESSFSSSPSNGMSPLWNEERRGEMISSPLANYSSTPQSMYMGYGAQGHAGHDLRLSAVRAHRAQMASPYSSPALRATPGASIAQHAAMTGQAIGGIITKRSRGRRVPNNPEELNNLGKSGKVYTCKVPGCGKCFKRSEHLKRHVRSIHTEDKPYMCHCGKTFSRHDNLNQHARVHQQGYSGSSSSPVTSPHPGSVSPAVSIMSLNSCDARRNLSAAVKSRLRSVVTDDDECEAGDGTSEYINLDA